MRKRTKHHTFTVRNPSYGPKGQPCSVVWRGKSGVQHQWCWTLEEAQSLRDVLLDADIKHVQILGMPTTASGG